jgi:cation transport ATPase
MSIEDKDMPLKRIIIITSVMALLGLIVFFVAGEYRALGTLMMFTAVMLWVYRLFLRKWANNVLTAQLIAIAILGHGTRVAWLELALTTPIVGWVALPFYDRALASLRRRRANMFALASLGVLTAYLYSAVATIAPSIHDGRSLYFSAAGSTVTVVLLGEAIERWVRRRASAEIADVTTVRRALSPTTAIEDVADRISAAIVPAALAVAALTLAGWMALGPSPKIAHAIEATVAVLVIACPAAIALASPLSYLMATASAKRDGMNLRDPKLTETLARVTTLILDRTGVLTEGRPVVRSVEAASGFAQAELLHLAAAAEYECEHPVARAVVAHAKDDEDGPQSVRRPVAGRGVVAEVRGHDVVLGARRSSSGRAASASPRCSTRWRRGWTSPSVPCGRATARGATRRRARSYSTSATGRAGSTRPASAPSACTT